MENDYRVRLLIDSLAFNVDFDPSQPASAKNPRMIVKPAGTVIANSLCWLLCLPDAWSEKVKAEPLDEFTQARVIREQQRSAAVLKERARRNAAAQNQVKAGKRRSR